MGWCKLRKVKNCKKFPRYDLANGPAIAAAGVRVLELIISFCTSQASFLLQAQVLDMAPKLSPGKNFMCTQ